MNDTAPLAGLSQRHPVTNRGNPHGPARSTPRRRWCWDSFSCFGIDLRSPRQQSQSIDRYHRAI